MAQPTISTFDSGSTTNASDANNDYFTTSKTFTAGHLYVMALFLTSAASAPADPAVTFATEGSSWTKLRSRQDTTNHVNGSIWYRRVDTTVTSNQVKIDGAAAMTGWDWIIVDVTGFFDDGTIANTFPQSNDNQATSATPSVSLGSAPTSGNRTLGAILAYANQAITQGANFTEVVETGGHSNPPVRAELERDTSAAQQTMDWSMTSAGYMALGVEIKAQAITPAALALTLTAVAPSISQQVAPAALALTLTAVAPTINQAAGDPHPDPIALTLTAVAPSVTQQVVPGALSLTVTPVAPSVAQSISPAALSLTVAPVAPTVAQSVAPGALSLTLTPVAPSVKQQVAPGVLSLTLTPVAPTLQQAGFVSMPALALTLTPVAPSVAQSVAPGAIGLTLAVLEPSLAQSVAPDPVALVLVPLAPDSISISQHVEMPAISLTLRLRRINVRQTPPGNIDVDFGNAGSGWDAASSGSEWATSNAGGAWTTGEAE